MKESVLDQKLRTFGQETRNLLDEGQGEEAFTTTGKDNWKKRKKNHRKNQRKEPAMKTEIDPKTKEMARNKIKIMGGIVVVGLIAALLSPELEAKIQADEAQTSDSKARASESGEELFSAEQKTLIGQQVVVTGTDAQGLILRNGPGTENKMIGSAWDGEIFTVIGGPENADGYTWWQLKEPMTDIVYWAADSFLSSK